MCLFCSCAFVVYVLLRFRLSVLCGLVRVCVRLRVVRVCLYVCDVACVRVYLRDYVFVCVIALTRVFVHVVCLFVFGVRAVVCVVVLFV